MLHHFNEMKFEGPACSLLNAGHLLRITAQKRDAISDHFQIRFHGSFLEGMEEMITDGIAVIISKSASTAAFSKGWRSAGNCVRIQSQNSAV